MPVMPEGTEAALNRPLHFREFASAWADANRTNAVTRKSAQGTLNPAMIERAIRTGDGVEVNEQQGPGFYGPNELKTFRKAMQSVQREFGGGKGATPQQLIAMSTKADVERANMEIKTSRMYRIVGSVVHFAVKASGKNNFDGNYNVRIKFNDWSDAMVSGRTWKGAAQMLVRGRVSIDCTCGRHQYWFRYLAGVGGFAVAPPVEKDFPKIRNPSLEGACCKHVLKALQSLSSPTIQNLLAGELERQASATGYAATSGRFLTKEELAKAGRARPKEVNQAAAAKAYNDYRKSVKALKTKVRQTGKKKMDLEDENRALKAKDAARVAQLKKERAANQQLQQQSDLNRLAADLNAARMKAVMDAALSGNDPQKASAQATRSFAEDHAKRTGVAVGDVEALFKERGLL
ncbi:MAG: hypothetical protein OIF57_08720 [Marinobacterium sp.]|nr:hypothetical protein [Marinobacterium sp.]